MQFNSPDFKNTPLQQLAGLLEIDRESITYQALSLCQQAYVDSDSSMPSGMAVLWILRQLRADDVSCCAALLSDGRLQHIELETVAKVYGDDVASIVKSVRWLHGFTYTDALKTGVPEQAEQVRRLLMQAVSDVRAIFIKLAYRVERLRNLAQEPAAMQHGIAKNTLAIFAPLANRLGIGQLKWELEDLSFRCLEPDTYKQVASQLEEKRADREAYMQHFVAELVQLLAVESVEAEVLGRPKHIYSIVKKMRRKSVGFDELYDVRAVRVIVNDLATCYAVLGLVHNRWRYLAAEFDDYIARPKENGYQSLHTVVLGVGNKPVEIQIRTRRMHELAESGVAAHWRYKEQAQGVDEQLEHSIHALRQILESGSVDEELLSQFQTHTRSQRVYVFTPAGDVVDLREGSTPLDFAYTIHTDIGHRCRGAKVNGRIVSLSYVLQDADKVEILTAREAAPTREWLNPQLGYIHSSNIRAKVRAWFNKRDYEQNVEDGGYIFERELNRYQGRSVEDQAYAEHFGRVSVDAMLADIGRGLISSQQLSAAIQLLKRPEEDALVPRPRRKPRGASDIEVSGVGNLLTQRASCCLPIPGEEIVGYVTRGRGVSVHRRDCKNVRALEVGDADRLIPVAWGGEEEAAQALGVDIVLEAYDREGLLRDVSSVLSREHAYLNAVNTRSDRQAQTANMEISVELSDVKKLSVLIDKLLQIPNVFRVERVFR